MIHTRKRAFSDFIRRLLADAASLVRTEWGFSEVLLPSEQASSLVCVWMPRAHHEDAASTGYEIRSHRVDFYGICADCRVPA